MEKSYGITQRSEAATDLDFHLECVRNKGFSLMKNVLSEEEVALFVQKVEDIYAQQQEDFGSEKLGLINELNIVRAPLAYDPKFLELITKPRIKEYVKGMLGDYYSLHLQNAVINRPNIVHHQTSWHRDLPYQNFVISTPLAVNAFYCLAPFNAHTGGTLLLPFSHRIEYMPSQRYVEENIHQVEAEAGDVILFDSMVFHKAGKNNSDSVRIGINNVFVKPILSQQIDLPKLLDGKYSDDPELSVLLGYRFEAPDSVDNYRAKRLERMQGK